MKLYKWSLLLFLSVLCLSCMLVSCEKSKTEEISLSYRLKDDGTYAVSAGENKDFTTLVIPAEYNGKPITEIDDEGFIRCGALENLVIAPSISRIGNKAFFACSSLETVTLPAGVKTIGKQAFTNTGTIENLFVSDLSAWLNLTVEDGSAGPLHQGTRFYLKDQLLKELVIPEGVKHIRDSAFEGCNTILSVAIPKSVESIGSKAFMGCDSLQTVTMEKGVQTIGTAAFSGCYYLSDIQLSDSLESISSYAFLGCMSLSGITLPESLVTLEKGAFSCPRLVEIINYSSLELTPGSLDAGGVARFALEIHTGESRLHREGEFLFYTASTGKHYLNRYLGNDAHVTLPATCQGEQYEIGAYALSEDFNHNQLLSVTVPEGITELGDGAFQDCHLLEAVTLPESLTYIGHYAFAQTSLTAVVLPDGVKAVGENAFYSCHKLTSIDLGSGLESIGKGAFSMCASLQTVTVPASVTYIGASAFGGGYVGSIVFENPNGWYRYAEDGVAKEYISGEDLPTAIRMEAMPGHTYHDYWRE